MGAPVDRSGYDSISRTNVKGSPPSPPPPVGTGQTQTPNSQHKGDLLPWRGKLGVGYKGRRQAAASFRKQGCFVLFLHECVFEEKKGDSVPE